MATIKGQFYEAHVSARHCATLDLYNGNYQLICDEAANRSGTISRLVFSDRTGNIARRIQWPDGAVFESTDNDTIDRALGTKATGILHTLESQWRYIPAAIALIAFAFFGAFKWGLPAASYHIARQLPVSAHELVSTGAMKTLDKIMFAPSQLPEHKKQQVSKSFSKLIDHLDTSPFNYQLFFRDMSFDNTAIANAMALPAGQIIVTDELVRIAEPEELEAVLLHEIGHVEEHHGMQQALNASAVTVTVSLTLGEMSGLGDLITAVPVFLLHSNYSRKNESAADAFAFKQMAELGIDPKHFASIIKRIGGSEDTEGSASYLSSHPGSAQRAKQALEASADFNISK